MNFLQIRNRIALVVQIEGWTEVSPAPDIPTLANQALAMFSIEAELFVKSDSSVTSTTGVSQYTIPGKWGKITEVLNKGVPLRRSTEDAERYAFPGGFAATPGVPDKFVNTGFGQITMVPAPNSSNVGTILARGIQEAPAMIADTDEPGQANGSGTVIPSALHEGIVARGAFLQGLAYIGSADSPRMHYFDQLYQYYVDLARGGLNAGFKRIPSPGQAG